MSRLTVKVGIASGAVARLTAALAAVEPKAARRATRAGINEITKLVLADARARVPRRSGQLKKSLGRRVRGYRRGEVVSGIVGPRRGFRVVIGGVAVNPVKYAHLVEFGRGVSRAGQRSVIRSGRRVTEKTQSKVLSSFYTAVAPDTAKVFGPVVGPAAARPFMRPAWDENRGLAARVLARHLSLALQKIAGPGAAIRAAGPPPDTATGE